MKKQLRVMDDHFQRGLAHLDAGEHGAAWGEFTQALRHAPNAKRAPIRSLRAKASASQGDWHAVIRDTDAALRCEPKFELAFFLRGLAHGYFGRYDQAIADFTELLALAPHARSIYVFRGHAHMMRGDFEPALADFNAALSVAPDVTSTSLFRRERYSTLGTAYVAVDDGESSTRRNRCWVSIHDLRAACLRALGEHELAAEELGRAIELRPDDIVAFQARAQCYWALGDPVHAIADESHAAMLRSRAMDSFRLADEAADVAPATDDDCETHASFLP